MSRVGYVLGHQGNMGLIVDDSECRVADVLSDW